VNCQNEAPYLSPSCFPPSPHYPLFPKDYPPELKTPLNNEHWGSGGVLRVRGERGRSKGGLGGKEGEGGELPEPMISLSGL